MARPKKHQVKNYKPLFRPADSWASMRANMDSMDSTTSSEWQIPLARSQEISEEAPDFAVSVGAAPAAATSARERVRGLLVCLAPHPAALLGFFVVLLAFLVTHAVLRWQVRSERRVLWVEQGRVPGIV
jgi:hypothetical protein